MKYHLYSFHWSAGEYTMREVVQNFKSQLPFLVVVTDGYQGRDEHLHALASDQIYWLYRIRYQTRVVTRSEGRYISIPENSPIKVHGFTSSGKAKSDISIAEMIKEKCQYFIFADGERPELFEGAGDGDFIKKERMKVEDVYHEPYFIAHSLCSDKLCDVEVTIPSYMPVSIALATGLVGASSQAFEKTIFDLRQQADSFKHSNGKPCNEIMVFEGKPVEGVYEYLPPKRFIEQLNRRSERFESQPHDMTQNATYHAYETIPVEKPKQPNEWPLPPRRRHSIGSGQPIAGQGLLPSGPQEMKKRSQSISHKPGNQLQLYPGEEQAFGITTPPTDGGGQTFSKRPAQADFRTQLNVTRKDIFNKRKSHHVAKHEGQGPLVPQQPNSPTSMPHADSDASCNITSLSAIPSDVRQLTVQEVCRCLKLLKMECYVDAFGKELVDGRLLSTMDEALLKESLDMTTFHAKKLVAFTKGWRPNVA